MEVPIQDRAAVGSLREEVKWFRANGFREGIGKVEGDALPAALNISDRSAAQPHVIGDVRLAKLSPHPEVPQTPPELLVDRLHGTSMSRSTSHVNSANMFALHTRTHVLIVWCLTIIARLASLAEGMATPGVLQTPAGQGA